MTQTASPSGARPVGRIRRMLPILGWAPRYSANAFGDDALAAAIVTVMLIPQSLAYALIAGLPPETGLYASMAPLLFYAVFGTSATLAVGPVAVVSLMTAAAVGEVARQGTPEYAGAALALAAIVGLLLLAMGAFRLGFLANFLSHPIISGFISASGLLIAASQLGHVLGVDVHGETIIEIARSLAAGAASVHGPTMLVGFSVIAFLGWSRRGLKPVLKALGVAERTATMIARAAPLFAIVATIAATRLLALDAEGVAIVGPTPAGLPRIAPPPFELALWRELLGSAALIAIIGFVESVSIAQTLAARRRERIDLDQELIALGACNVAAGCSGGFPVTGGFARSVVNFDAGARTPAAGAFTAAGIALAAVFLTPLIHDLPKATLAATIIVAVLALVDIGAMKRTLHYSRSDFVAMMTTVLGVLFLGVEAGIVAGVVLSILFILYKASRPHSAIVGQVPGTEHFRNVERHAVVTSPILATLRVDGDLFFANSRHLEDTVLRLVAARPGLRHVILQCSAVNAIDATALETLEALNEQLQSMGVLLHLSEVKGPVMDRLKRSHLLEKLTGAVYLSQYQAAHDLDPKTFTLSPPSAER